MSVDAASFNAVLARLESVADRLERGAAGTGGAAPAASNAAADEAAIAISLDTFTSLKLTPIEQAAKELDVKDVLEATEMLVTGFRLLRSVLAATSKCSKPKDGDWPKILGAVMELGQKAQKACDNRSEYFQNRKAVAEALNVMTLVTSPSPPSHVQNVLETLDFHAIKVMQKKNPPETTWIKAIKESVKDMKDWCTENCKMGLIWNAQGEEPVAYFAAHPLGTAPEAAGSAGSPPKGKGKGRGAAPPVPKGGFAPPPPELLAKRRGETPAAGGAEPKAGGMGALFDAISTFSTGGLKKVTSDMKTKNQPKDGPSTVPAAKAKAAAVVPAGKSGAKGPKGPPIKELQKGTNWFIENYADTPDLTLEEAEKHHLVCIINCKNTTLQIKSKVKSVSIDGCEKCNIICQDVISAVELVNCERCQVQTTGKVNSFAIDKCNGVNLYIPKESLQAEFVTSKSSEMNVTIPDVEGEEGDTIEMPIPEQFVTRVSGRKKLATEVSGIYTG